MNDDTAFAIELMSDFAERTNVGEAGSERYLWTDAFALINALALERRSSQDRWRVQAARIIADVHQVLGRHRPDDERRGWLSGLPEEEGARHPTAAGLRIGKPDPERRADEPFDERLEWDRDGQYWHYLTKWMHALDRAAVLLGEPDYERYARELARGTFPRFLQKSASGEPLGLAWKMSVDLSRPQIAATGAHDALDGYVTFRWLDRARGDSALGDGALGDETAILLDLAQGHNWTTSDPLGLGGLLLDAFRLSLLPDRTADDERLIAMILTGTDRGLAQFAGQQMLDRPPQQRLGFRELGLSIGMQALPAIAREVDQSLDLARAVGPSLERLNGKQDLARRIVAFWSKAENRQASTWAEHRSINEVMLATALLDAYADTMGRS